MKSILQSLLLALTFLVASRVPVTAGGAYTPCFRAPVRGTTPSPDRLIDTTRRSRGLTRHATIDTVALRKKVVFPKSELKPGAYGQATAKIEVSTKGTGKFLALDSYGMYYREAARRALKTAKYTSARVNGVAVPETLLVNIFFNVPPAPEKPVPHVSFTVARLMTELPNGDPNGLGPVSTPVVEKKQTDLQGLEATEGPFPADDEFVPVAYEPKYDESDLARRLKYPEEARRNGIEGQVILKALIGRSGRVIRTMVDRTDSRLFNATAEQALMATKFTPAKTSDGRTVAVWIQVPFTFKLQ